MKYENAQFQKKNVKHFLNDLLKIIFKKAK